MVIIQSIEDSHQDYVEGIETAAEMTNKLEGIFVFSYYSMTLILPKLSHLQARASQMEKNVILGKWKLGTRMVSEEISPVPGRFAIRTTDTLQATWSEF